MKITDALKIEHTIYNRILDAIEARLNRDTSIAEVRLAAHLIESFLAAHGSAEEDLLFVALNHMLAHTEKLPQMRQEHQELDSRIRSIDKMSKPAEAARFLKGIITGIRQHFQWEEKEVFPLAENLLHEKSLNALGTQVLPNIRSRQESRVAAG